MCLCLAGASGIEPELMSSKPIVLPLHNAPTKNPNCKRTVLIGKDTINSETNSTSKINVCQPVSGLKTKNPLDFHLRGFW